MLKEALLKEWSHINLTNVNILCQPNVIGTQPQIGWDFITKLTGLRINFLLNKTRKSIAFIRYYRKIINCPFVFTLRSYPNNI